MTSLDQWQRMTPKQQWDAFNALQNAQAVHAKAVIDKHVEMIELAVETADEFSAFVDLSAEVLAEDEDVD